MNSFWKTVLAVIVGTVCVSLISCLFTTCVFVGMVASASQTEKPAATSEGDILLLKINGTVNEIPSAMPFDIGLMGISKNESANLRDCLNAIAAAEADKNIQGIYLNTDGMTAAPATYEAIRHALVKFRESGKWIISYNDSYSQAQYYLASVADSVYVNYVGEVVFNGLSHQSEYPKQLFDKLGVVPQVFRVGQFKSAVEPYMVEHMSEANRLQTEVYMTTNWNTMIEEISASRGISTEALDSLANLAVGYMVPEDVAKTGLVDGMLYKSEVEKLLLEKMGQEKLEGHAVTLKQMAASYKELFPQDQEDKVAVLYAVGEISSDAKGNGDGIFYESLIKEIKGIAEDEHAKAVVLRVNSPGGSAFASEQIWKALQDLKATGKPLVISMGDYAASGGYYISSPGDYIFAEPNTLTGSIGIFGVIFNLSGLVTDKLGVNIEEVKTHHFGELHPFRAVTNEEGALIQHSVEQGYELFTSRCSQGRGLSQDSIKVIGGGRVWMGKDALNIGLVDELGGLDEAIAKAAALANLEEGSYSRAVYPLEKSQMETFMALLDESKEDLTLRIVDHITGGTPAERETLKFIESLKNTDHLQARCLDTLVY